jgi:hypothetical protein
MSFQQPPPPPQPPYQQSPYPVPPPPAPSPGWARKRVIVPTAALILVVGIVIGSAGGGGTEKTSADPAPTVTKTVGANAESVAEPAPTVTVTETAKAEAAPKKETTKEETATAPEGKAVFKVWGSAPNGVDITYGSDGTNLEGSGLPMTKTLTVDEDSLYYQISAQLMGGGDVQCSVTIDGETRSGRAKGSYNICSAQLNSDFSGGFS